VLSDTIAKQDASTHDEAATDVQTIISAVQLAQTKIVAIKSAGLKKRQSSDDVANLVAGVVGVSFDILHFVTQP
jgi:hypothetical protein